MFRYLCYRSLDLMYDNGDWFFRSLERGLERKKPIYFHVI